MTGWREPTAGEIVWWHFPDDITTPRPKPRPALILTVFDDDAPPFVVRVAYGTSQRTTQLYHGEFAILRNQNPAAYAAFSVPPAAPHRQTPTLGTLHPSLVHAVETAFRVADQLKRDCAVS